MTKELPNAEQVPLSLATQPEEERARDRVEAEGREAECRAACFAKILEIHPELTEDQRAAIQRAMETQKTRLWASYDGIDVKVMGVSVNGNVIRITFELEELGGIEVDELVVF